jgi:hypothetical protein
LNKFKAGILKRFKPGEDQEKISNKLSEMVMYKRKQSRSRDALKFIHSMEINSKNSASFLLEGLVSYLYPKDEYFRPDGRYWFDYSNFDVIFSFQNVGIPNFISS